MSYPIRPIRVKKNKKRPTHAKRCVRIKPHFRSTPQSINVMDFVANTKSSSNDLSKIQQVDSHQTKSTTVDLWENPPEPSEDLKCLFQKFKHLITPNDTWNGHFYL